MTPRKNTLFALFLLLTIPATAVADSHPKLLWNTPMPPPAPVRPVRETICDTTLTDPYRYMEKLHEPEVSQWMREQSAFTRKVLNRIPGRKELLKKMQSLDSRKLSKIYNLAITENNRYFYLKQSLSDETGKLFYREGFDGEEHLLFDPEKYSGNKSGNYVIGTISPNDDGSRVAFTVYPNGTENATLLIMETETARLYPETISRCRFASPSWLPDGNRFLYNRLEKQVKNEQNPQYDSKTWLHRIGTDPSSDRELFSRTLNTELEIGPADIPQVLVDKSSGYLFGFVSNVDRRLTVYYAPVSDLEKEHIAWKKLFRPEDGIHDFAATSEELYLYTAKKASDFRLLKTSLQQPDLENAEVVIPEFSGSTLSGFTLTSDGIFYTLSTNGVQEELFYQPYGSKRGRKIQLPFRANTITLSSKGFRFPEIWTILSSWNKDYRRFRVEAATDSFRNETLSSPAEYPEYNDLVVEEITVPSHDGVSVPLSLIYRKNLVKNGSNPVLLYGYGAYGYSITPFFNPYMLLWAWKGGVLAISHVRGGGELGNRWHTAGMKTTKANTWQDAIAAAEYLIRNRYTSAGHIAINGASAGGIMVGRAITERPELFGTAIPQVGAMNPLRGEETPNGPVNVPEFGTVTIPEECRALIAMDPYLHIREGVNYPSALITAGIHDPRMIAWQPAKFAARLQAASVSSKPVLFFTDFDAGHGIGNSKTKNFETLADVLSFGLWQTGHPEFSIEHRE